MQTIVKLEEALSFGNASSSNPARKSAVDIGQTVDHNDSATVALFIDQEHRELFGPLRWSKMQSHSVVVGWKPAKK